MSVGKFVAHEKAAAQNATSSRGNRSVVMSRGNDVVVRNPIAGNQTRDRYTKTAAIERKSYFPGLMHSFLFFTVQDYHFQKNRLDFYDL